MADKPKRRSRRAHLDDFKKDESGQYVYTGKCYAFDGEDRQRRRFLWIVGVGTLLAAVGVILPECFAPAAISRSYITLLPWLALVISVFLLAWTATRLLWRMRELRAYIYAATVPRLPRRALASTICAGATLLAQIVFIVLYGLDGAFPTLIRPAMTILTGAASFLLYRVAVTTRWREVETLSTSRDS